MSKRKTSVPKKVQDWVVIVQDPNTEEGEVVYGLFSTKKEAWQFIHAMISEDEDPEDPDMVAVRLLQNPVDIMEESK